MVASWQNRKDVLNDDWGPKTKQNTPSLETSRELGNGNKHVQTPSSVAFATDKWRIRLRNRVTLDRPEQGAKHMKVERITLEPFSTRSSRQVMFSGFLL